MYGVTPDFGGVKVVFRFNKFKFDQGKFKMLLGLQINSMLKNAGRSAFAQTYGVVPVFTGESRGGLNPIIDALGGEKISVSPRPGAIREWRKNRFTGQVKTPYSAQTTVSGPRITIDNRILFTYTTSAEGFVLGDKKVLPNSESSPFRFARSFMFQWRVFFAAEVHKHPQVSLRSFSATQRATYYVDE